MIDCLLSSSRIDFINLINLIPDNHYNTYIIDIKKGVYKLDANTIKRIYLLHFKLDKSCHVYIDDTIYNIIWNDISINIFYYLSLEETKFILYNVTSSILINLLQYLPKSTIMHYIKNI